MVTSDKQEREYIGETDVREIIIGRLNKFILNVDGWLNIYLNGKELENYICDIDNDIIKFDNGLIISLLDFLEIILLEGDKSPWTVEWCNK